MDRFDPSTADVLAALSAPAPDDPRSVTRRRFLQAAAVTGSVAMLPNWLADAAHAATPLGASDGVIVLITMYGGNDGLSMVAPFADGNYRTMRGGLAIGANPAMQLSNSRVLHPNLGYVKQMWDQGRVAVLEGIGHPQPDLSHFTSMARWMTASTSPSVMSTGWLGRYVDGLSGGPDAFHSITIDSSVPLTLQGQTQSATALPSTVSGLLSLDADPVYQRQYATLHQMAAGSTGLGALADSLAASASESLSLATSVRTHYNPALPSDELAAKLTLCARLINANLGVRVLNVGFGDFDSHANQRYMHGERMRELNTALQAFFTELSPSFAGRTLVLTASEFGRRAWANESGGTDHGTANTLLALGAGVNGGFYGAMPNLAGLRRWDNLDAMVDYRNVYGNVLERWLGADSAQVIGADYPDMGFLKTPSGTGSSSGSISGSPGGSRIQLSRLYQAYFRRVPDDAGLEFWLSQRRAGMSLAAVSAEFARSAEFVQTYGRLDAAGFVDLIYANVLRRAPDEAGRAYWIGLLNSGTDRGRIMTGFSESSEFVTLTTPELVEHEKTGPIGRLYRAYLDREGDPAGIAYWLGTNAPLTTVSEQFALSTEFVRRYGAMSNEQFVNQIYQNVMKRQADSAGLKFWTGQLKAGRTRGEIMLQFSNSEEFIAKLRQG